MQSCYIKLAAHTIKVNAIYETTMEFCKEYLLPNDICGCDFDLEITVEQKDIELERQKSESEDIKECIPIRHFSDEYLETLAVYRQIAEQMVDYDTLLFHGSAIAVDGQGYLFTAKSGTGKSTHTRLWREYFGERAVMVNDDKPLLKITEDGVTIYGTPWDGKHRLSNNISVLLKAICILNRDETNHIEQVSGRKGYPLLLQQTYRSAEPLKLMRTLELLDRMIENTSIYSLGCNMRPEAAKVAYEGMQTVTSKERRETK
ncbi:hypothetical protein [Hespellia stercorisuis]|uniref:SynChlorMet cassette protein ScmC n=1 Tax=Hespellia stercorisuis DSM 15480 TaxID=1121950 RepID=A0A1M6UA62_9FIRM|nr:hypothetical protein [Hespellia stercorisuis]SHK66066.1 hypothetical protein SAMN02745243_03448 [Hespellia stercorisuis DSM 15480]